MNNVRNDTRRLVLVSNRLSANYLIKDNELQSSESTGGLVTGLSSYLKSLDSPSSPIHEYLWIGWPGSAIPDIFKEQVVRSAYSEHRSYPVFLSDEEMDNFYHGFCNKTIWPLFHYFATHVVYKKTYWEHYKKVNELFCDALLKVVTPNDIVWIHDYHLMLLPKLLKEKMPDVPIGFFLHIPFPSFEVFRLLPGEWRREILSGLLGADLVGFHTYDYTQHFLQCVLRILGHEHQLGKISLPYRAVVADTFPMGIDYEKFSGALENPEVKHLYNESAIILSGLKVILSVDRLDYTKGILARLEAYEMLLDSYPEYHEKIVLVIIVVPSRVAVDQYEMMKKQIEEFIGKINGKFGTVGWTPVNYQYKFKSFEPLMAFYNLSDVALVTPLRDGMNLVAKEYVASQKDKKGVLILSEMAGAAKELAEAIIINPNNIEEIAAAMKEALDMPEEEQIRRNTIMQNRLRRYDVVRWANEFTHKLSVVVGAKTDVRVRLLSNSHREGFFDSFSAGTRRLLFLDYDGTLTPLVRRPDQARPTEKILRLLHSLGENARNTVVLISGRERRVLEQWFGALPIRLVAEHGVWIKELNEDWKLLREQSNAWKSNILPILEQFADRLPGAFVEEKEYTLTWHYRTADPEQSRILARELTDHLVSYTANIDLQIIQGHKVIEVRTIGTDKGKAALTLISEYKPDFILALGDDATDEDLFQQLPEQAYGVHVGYANTHAKYYLRDPGEVVRLLEEIAKQDGID